jgi:hypothetical protein
MPRRDRRVTAGSGLRYRRVMPERTASPHGPEVPDLVDVTDVGALLAALQALPDDESLRERAATALLDAGRGYEVPGLLQSGLVHLNAHDEGTLPCLCKRCLDPALNRAVVSGTEFARDHAVAHGRVLFYWLPVSLAGSRAEVRRNVVARLRKQLSLRNASTP